MGTQKKTKAPFPSGSSNFYFAMTILCKTQGCKLGMKPCVGETIRGLLAYKSARIENKNILFFKMGKSGSQMEESLRFQICSQSVAWLGWLPLCWDFRVIARANFCGGRGRNHLLRLASGLLGKSQMSVQPPAQPPTANPEASWPLVSCNLCPYPGTRNSWLIWAIFWYLFNWQPTEGKFPFRVRHLDFRKISHGLNEF